MSVNPRKHNPRTESFILTIGQSQIQKQLGFIANSVIVTNLTNQWIFVEEAFAFIGPYISGRQIPLSGGQKVTIGFQTPVGFNQPTSIAGQVVVILATEMVLPTTPGVAIAPGAVQWSIIHFPATGVQASVTKAAVPGVIHVVNNVLASYFLGSAGGPNLSRVNVLDGISGSGVALLSWLMGVTNVIGTGATLANGPGLGIKGTIGNAQTIEFQSGVAGTFQTVDEVGYDV